ncbi:MAG TPA: pantetheine-phosphate adenylyltransferase [Bacillota bacterium]|jgi:pantetheine-phosphate adenylyltransferase|nr:pantetheine-phosphate adenylyltransferase [Bacillota bacterium]HQC49377.1 pantetheine-phosphate adenylyltransferase [Bacillota bacterium]
MQQNESSVRFGLAVFSGTFDPFTAGHLDLVERARRFCSELRIVVFDNSSKTPVMPKGDRMTLIGRAVEHLDNVTVDAGEGLLANYCILHGVDVIIRGVRNGFQFEEESVMAELNKRLSCGVETIFFPAAELRHVSSTLVREIARYGGDLGDLVPPEIKEDIEKAYGSQ